LNHFIYFLLSVIVICHQPAFTKLFDILNALSLRLGIR
jgi:hypothetical protein